MVQMRRVTLGGGRDWPSVLSPHWPLPWGPLSGSDEERGQTALSLGAGTDVTGLCTGRGTISLS